MQKTQETVQRLINKKLLQIDELNVLQHVVNNRSKKLTDSSEISKNKILLDNIITNIDNANKEIVEFNEVLTNALE